MVGPIDKEILGREVEIDRLEITSSEQARMIKELEAELEVFQREAEEEDQTGIFNVKSERAETKSNEARAMELEAQVFETERARARQIWRDNALKADIAEAEERERRDDIEGEEHMRFLG